MNACFTALCCRAHAMPAPDSSADAPESRFALRIVQLDSVLENPQDGLDHMRSAITGLPLRRVPMLRIFGLTPRGQTACLHVHGVFRYFLVPFDGEPATDPAALRVQLQALALDLNMAMSSVGGRAQERVFDMSVVYRTPFYGYHAEERPFVRVEMVEPSSVEEAQASFAAGRVGGRGPI